MSKGKDSDWNKWRAGTAQAALEVFVEHTGGNEVNERAEMVGDLICNLGHYCVQHDLDFDEIALRAMRCWADEHRIGDDEYNGEPPPC